jgi:hypothetical protein
MRGLLFGAVATVAISVLPGCGRSVDSREFGTIVQGIPQVEGADKPFEMPKLGPPPSPEEVRKAQHRP